MNDGRYRWAHRLAGWLVLLCGVLTAFAPLRAQMRGETLTLLEYNVENLFDCRDDTGFDNEDFLPAGAYAWDTLRYRRKLVDLARVMVAAGGARPVDLVALCEVEGDSVLRDLTCRTRLARLGYRYAVTDSRDRRGMDVALLYQPERFRPVSIDTLRIGYDARRERPTRDVLHVAGRIPTGDTLDVIVVHLPSRRGGAQHTEDYRLRAARRVVVMADSLRRVRAVPAVIITGDFNDGPADRSLYEVVGARPLSVLSRQDEAPDCHWVNLSAELRDEAYGVEGTYRFRGFWNRLDHVIVNRWLLAAHPRLRTGEGACRILTLPFLMEQSRGQERAWQPRRTYLGTHYHGGISDHLPLLLTIAVDMSR